MAVSNLEVQSKPTLDLSREAGDGSLDLRERYGQVR
jgi:hypothetical protein